MTQTYYAKVEKTEYSSMDLEFTATSDEDAKIKALKLAKDWDSNDGWEEEGDVFVVQYVEELT